MKYLIIFLISWSAYASSIYFKVEEGKIVYSTFNKELCDDCIKADTDEGYDPEVSDITTVKGEKVAVPNEAKKLAKKEAKEKAVAEYEYLKNILKDGKTLSTKQISDMLRFILGV